MSLDVQTRDTHALDAVQMPEVAPRYDRAIKRAHNLTDVDGDPAIGQLIKADWLVVGAGAVHCSIQ